MFKCEWCEEEYDDSVKFYVVLVDKNDKIEKGNCCPDCIAVWFTDDAENLISVNIMKLEA